MSYRALCPLPSWVATTSTFLVFAVGRTEHRTSTCKGDGDGDYNNDHHDDDDDDDGLG